MPTEKIVLKFDAHAVRELLDHAKSCKEFIPAAGQMFDPEYRLDGKAVEDGNCPSIGEVDPKKLAYGLHLVADHGVYLKSNGLPEDSYSSMPAVIYAQGNNLDGDGSEDRRKRKESVFGGGDNPLFLSGESIERALKLRVKDGVFEIEIFREEDGDTLVLV